jgi:hypothetical protein
MRRPPFFVFNRGDTGKRTMRLIDLTGKKFGLWTVLALHPKRMRYGKAGQAVVALWLGHCDCGTERLVFGPNLRRGLSLSCGCLAREQTRKRNTKHGHAVRGQHTRAYNTWQHLKQRCLNPNNKAYAYYGGRGISVCEDWLGFENYFADMLDPPDGLSIDRVDNNGPYASWNCRWATSSMQSANRRPWKRKRCRSDVTAIIAFANALARAAGSNSSPRS